MGVAEIVKQSLMLSAVLCASGADIVSADDDSASVATACLRRSDIRTTKILSDRNVLFITRDRTTYNNQLARKCPGLRRNAVPSFTFANNGKLCTGSTFTVLYRASMNTNRVPYWDPFTQKATTLDGPAFTMGPTCQIGLFTPITEDELKALMAATDEPKPSRRRSDRDALKTEPVQAAPTAKPAAAQ